VALTVALGDNGASCSHSKPVATRGGFLRACFCTCLFGRLPSAFVASYPAIWAAWAALKTHLVASKHISSTSMPQRPTFFDRFQALYHADCLRDIEWTNPAAELETFGLTRAGSTGHGALSPCRPVAAHYHTLSAVVMCTG
jgi:hypothetical protein